VKVASVILNTRTKALDKEFHYIIPKSLEDKCTVGVRVMVPFGVREKIVEAIVVKILGGSEYDTLKEVIEVVDPEPLFGEYEAQLAKKISHRFVSTYLEALKLFIPAGIFYKFEEEVILNENLTQDEIRKLVKNSKKQEEIVEILLREDGKVNINALKDEVGNVRSSLNALAKKGVISIRQEQTQGVRPKIVRYYYLAADEDVSDLFDLYKDRRPAQARIIDVLSQYDYLSAPDILSYANCSRGALDSLCAAGVVAFFDKEVSRTSIEVEKLEEEKEPTDEQRAAILDISKSLERRKNDKFLIHGVTGSGKTEVFLQVVKKALDMGLQSIVLVPEISLTPQMTKRFMSRFGNDLAILHSALSPGERLDEWNRIRRGEAKVVVGARSAIFAPCKNLGLIIIDEEHELTYKSELSPRYSAVEVAKMRSDGEGAVLVLASATPSIERYYEAKEGKYRLITMTKRYNNAPLPQVSIVDMRKELEEGNKSVFSRALKEEIEKRINLGEQTVIFLNKRGHSSFVSCRSCGFVYYCKNCNISLNYHSTTHELVCHFCGYKEGMKQICPKCQSTKIRTFGSGTQKVEEEIKKLFPNASCIRMDMDTTSTRHSHERILNRFEKEKIDILLGTQMVTKGLDFENITLVGVLAADLLLNIDDFRSNERTFNLITQVCGRAGRGEKPGEAIIQTYTPEHEVLEFAKNQDYAGFYNYEINFRKMFLYPPFSDIINVVISGVDKMAVSEASFGAYKFFVERTKGMDYEIYKLTDAPVSRIKGRYRRRFWIKTKDINPLLEPLKELSNYGLKYKKSKVSISIDINPVSMI